MNVIVVIPARGGSKRFPGKNVYSLAGKPLIAHPIDAAKKAKLVNRVLVSTDSEEIAGVAKEHGAEVPFLRPAEIAEDASPVIEAMRHTLAELEMREGYHVDYAVLLQPTTPLVTPEQIDAAIALALEKQADSVINVSVVDTINHPYNVRALQPDGTMHFWKEQEHYGITGASRPQFYHAANLWLSSYTTIMETKRLEGVKNYPIIIPTLYSADIDFKEDLERIEAIMSYHKHL